MMGAQQIVAILLFGLAMFMFGICAGMPLGWRFRDKELRRRYSPTNNWPFGDSRCGISDADRPLRQIREGF
jgi:hypothetical protein